MTASAPSLRFSRVGFDAPLDDSLYPRLSIETLTRFPLSLAPPFDSQAEKEKLISDARSEVATQVAATKSKMDKEIAEASEKAKADVDKQIAAAIAKLDAAKAESAKEVETKATELSNQIIQKVVEV